MARHYVQLLQEAVGKPMMGCGSLSLMDAAERSMTTLTWNETARPWPGERCLHELVAEQAKRTPDATAL
eukprot:7881395-Ditylum_brightwellii.AAC.1